LENQVSEYRGVPFVLPDPIPSEIHASHDVKEHNGSRYVVFICTWASDEPYDQVIKAASQIKTENVSVRITGKPPEGIRNSKLGDRVYLEGFVSESKYIKLISNAALVIDLTTRTDCLVCGAYEAAAVGTPCLLSSNKCSEELFFKGYLFTDNDASSIAEKIDEGLEIQKELALDIISFRKEYKQLFKFKLEKLKEIIISNPKYKK
jgi:glycosyltransferase involved in cell wall biosynthesis